MHCFKNPVTLMALALLLGGCQSMPWQSDFRADGTPAPTQKPNPLTASPAAPHETRSAKGTHQPEPEATEAEATANGDNARAALIWDRLFAGYALQQTDDPRYTREYDWYRSHPEYLQRVQKRAEPYLHMILNEAEKRNMPTELVLLPVVESAFQPFAYSHGRASGLWQFIPSTGKMFDLHQNWWYDGRRDVIASTRAALDYLQMLAARFDGDWELALASYNAGAGNVRKAIRRNQRKNLPTDYWSLKLPRETMSYVPRLLAVSRVFRDAPQIGITLQPIEDRPQLAEVSIDSQIDLAKAADMAGIDLDTLYRLNPAYNRWATAPGETARLLIPLENQSRFEQQLAALDDTDLVEWQRYKIRPGDVLGTIAQRHNTTVAIIREVNKLVSHTIRAGKHLLIPVASRSNDNYRLTLSERTRQQQAKKRKGDRIEHIVEPGDTLWDIARAYDLSHRAIARWNGIAPGDPLHIGQKLVLWTENTDTASKLVLNTTPVERTSQIRYTIRRGDSLWRIANRFNVTVSDLKRWNALTRNRLQPGQKLKLKVNVTEQL